MECSKFRYCHSPIRYCLAFEQRPDFHPERVVVGGGGEGGGVVVVVVVCLYSRSFLVIIQ